MIYHLQELEPRGGKIRNYIIRFFDEPVGPIDAETGQPWKKYCAMAVLTVADAVCEIGGVLEVRAPLEERAEKSIQCLSLLRGPVADELELLSMFGVRWDAERQVKRFVPVRLKRLAALAQWANSNLPAASALALVGGSGRLAPNSVLPSARFHAGASPPTPLPSKAAD